MALGKTESKNNNKLLVLRIKNKVKDEKTGKDIPIIPNLFEITEKIDNKWVTRPKMENNVSGTLTKIEVEDDEYEGNPYKKFKFFLSDNDTKETYLLDLRSTMLSRNLFNSILALTEFDKLSISLYKKEGKDKQEYANIALRQNGELIKGKYSLVDLPQPEEIKNSKGVVIKRDFAEVDNWYAEKLTELANKIGGKSSKPTEKVIESQSESKEDVPF